MFKKTLLMLAIAAGLSVPAMAGVEGAMATAKSSNTVIGIDISSQTTQSVAGGVNQGWYNICIQNLDTTSALYCGENVNVSSITANALIGTVIAPAASATAAATPTCFPIVQNTDFFCRTGKTTGTTRASVYRIK